MQKYSAIFLALLCVNLVASLELSPIDSSIMPSKSMHAELTSMLVEVEKTESPKTIKNFIEQVRGMMTKLEKDQEAHKAIAKKMKGQCDNESAYRKTEIAAAKSSLSKSRAARGICKASLKSSRKDLPELEAALRMYQSELKKAIEHRAREKKMYEQRKRDSSKESPSSKPSSRLSPKNSRDPSRPSPSSNTQSNSSDTSAS